MCGHNSRDAIADFQRLIRFIRSVIPEDPSQPAVSLRLFLS